ncbi:MAG: hypothetical protein ABSH20_16395 [Tepidisphaeraceae bacterium]|jgi:hypothetical protein
MNRITLALSFVCIAAIAGCTDQPAIFKSSDPALQKSVSQFRDDAATRFPYKAEAPRTTEDKVRAKVEYGIKRLDITNFTGQDLTQVEVWVNRQYVCYVPVLQDRELKHIEFPMLCNILGATFPKQNCDVRVEKVELLYAGEFHEIKVNAYDW